MAFYAFVGPILPGKLDDWKNLFAEVSGSRRSEYAESRRPLGITREIVWLQQSPQGDMVIVYWEVYDSARAMQVLCSSQDPYDR